jgi:hypothetical protein
MANIPNRDEFLAGVAAYDGNNCVYFEGLAGLQEGWGDPAKMADAIWPLLRNWHADFYRYGSGNPQAIASAIEQSIDSLNALRGRTIDTLCAADEPAIRTLFWAFAKATGRTNSKGFQASSVGAVKAMHLLLPGLLPLWDTAISDRYHCDQDAFGYIKFCRIMREFAAAVRPYLPIPDDRSILKRIDEFNYSSVVRLRAS